MKKVRGIKTKKVLSLRTVRLPAESGTIKIERIKAAVDSVLKKIDKETLMKLKIT